MHWVHPLTAGSNDLVGFPFDPGSCSIIKQEFGVNPELAWGAFVRPSAPKMIVDPTAFWPTLPAMWRWIPPGYAAAGDVGATVNRATMMRAKALPKVFLITQR